MTPIIGAWYKLLRETYHDFNLCCTCFKASAADKDKYAKIEAKIGRRLVGRMPSNLEHPPNFNLDATGDFFVGARGDTDVENRIARSNSSENSIPEVLHKNSRLDKEILRTTLHTHSRDVATPLGQSTQIKSDDAQRKGKVIVGSCHVGTASHSGMKAIGDFN